MTESERPLQVQAILQQITTAAVIDGHGRTLAGETANDRLQSITSECVARDSLNPPSLPSSLAKVPQIRAQMQTPSLQQVPQECAERGLCHRARWRLRLASNRWQLLAEHFFPIGMISSAVPFHRPSVISFILQFHSVDIVWFPCSLNCNLSLGSEGGQSKCKWCCRSKAAREKGKALL